MTAELKLTHSQIKSFVFPFYGQGLMAGLIALYLMLSVMSASAASVPQIDAGVETARFGPTITLFDNGKALMVGGVDRYGSGFFANAALYDQVKNAWTSAAPLAIARSGHTATLLPNGKVLVVGGYNAPSGKPAYLASGELYDPVTNTWSASGALVTARARHTATLLSNGKVLVAGGYNGVNLLSAELYDPATDRWAAVGPLMAPRSGHTATLLSNGKVLIAGGSTLSNAELYDPATNIWTMAGVLAIARSGHTATLLANGKVLVAAGLNKDGFPLASVELYDPASGQWTVAPDLAMPRMGHTATRLANGKVLIEGGSERNDGKYVYAPEIPPFSARSSVEMYDPAANKWMAAASLPAVRRNHSATLLTNGKILLAGGEIDRNYYPATPDLYDPVSAWSESGAPDSGRRATVLDNGTVLVLNELNGNVRLYDPEANAWTPAGTLTPARLYATETLLSDGKVLVTGGAVVNSRTVVPDSNLYNPTSNSWTFAPTLSTPRAAHSATLLANGKVLVAGGFQYNPPAANPPSLYLSSAELYDPASNSWSAAGTLGTARSAHRAILLPNAKVLVVGGFDANHLYEISSTAELYDPATNTWASAGATSSRPLTATQLVNGKVLVVGSGTSADLYDPANNTWTAVGPMAASHSYPSVTLLPSGKVLVAGGSSAELYDPASSKWTMTSAPIFGSFDSNTATLLQDGAVLVSGGYWGMDGLTTVPNANSQRYDPKADKWTAAGTFVTARLGQDATLLRNGKVLATGGASSGGAELFDLSMLNNYSDSWWNPNESGWGVNITDHGSNLFVQWFTYDESGHNQKYVISGGTFSNGKCRFSGALMRVTGPSWNLPTFDPDRVTRTNAGAASFDFCPAGLPDGAIKFDYTADGVSGSKQLARLSFGNDIPHWGGPANTGAADYSDVWWNPNESGWGVPVTQHGNNLFFRIFVYDIDNRPLLFVVPGVTMTSPSSFSGTLQLTSGPYFGSTPFDPNQVMRTNAGTASLSFSDTNNGVLSYTVNGVTKTKNITRLAF